MNIRYYILIAVRNFNRDRRTFLINIVGLTSGMICFLLIFLWINDEVNVDRFNDKTDQLYEVMKNIHFDGKIETDNFTPYRLASSLKSEMPEVLEAASYYDFSERDYPNGVLSFDDKDFSLKAALISEGFFKIFSYKLLFRNSDETSLGKDKILLSETAALRFFKSKEEAVGAMLSWKHSDFEGEFQVADVFKDPPKNSTLKFDVLFSFDVLQDLKEDLNEWYSSTGNTFILLDNHANIDNFNSKIKNYLNTKHALTKNLSLFVRLFSDRYLYGNYSNGVQNGGRIYYVRVFTLMAILIILIACINFINLATSQASQRTKSIGIMKTLGCGRYTLIAQFIIEAIILSLVSLGVALILVGFMLPSFNSIVGKQLSFQLIGSKGIVIILLLTLFTGFISGSYPAIYLTRLIPMIAMRGFTHNTLKDLWVRRGLVIMQFTISIIFIIGFLITNKQIKYALSKDLGYKRKDVIHFQWLGEFDNTYNAFFKQLQNTIGVISCSSIDGSILRNISTNANFHWNDSNVENISFPSPSVGYDFIRTMGIEILEGREFSKEFDPISEMNRVILNQEAVKVMGLKEPIGKMVGYANGNKEIIGVVKNFHYGSLHDQLQPMFLRYFPKGRDIIVRLDINAQHDIISRIKTLYKRFNLGSRPFEFTFLDDEYQALYTSEIRIADLSLYFTLLAVVISILGIFGLAHFTIQRRFREISIRKTYGADRWSILLMLSKDYLSSVYIAIILSIPLGYWILSRWLTNFSYSVELKWWYFLIASLLALAISWLTIIGQTLKASGINPVSGLKEK